MASPFRFIQTLSDLTHLCSELAGEKALGVDTEADSLHHYYPKVCLIQISTNQHTFLIDPLAIETMAPLAPLFASHKTKKMFHGADYDLRSLFRDFGMRVNNLFDTMVASQFTGEKEAALATVVKKRFGIAMDKKYQRANWSKRPLSTAMMVYAARDSAHLIRLYGELREELKSLGRLSWVEEECEILSLACTVGNNADGNERNGERGTDATHRGASGNLEKAAPPPSSNDLKGRGRWYRGILQSLRVSSSSARRQLWNRTGLLSGSSQTVFSKTWSLRNLLTGRP